MVAVALFTVLRPIESLRAQSLLDQAGITQLRALDPTLLGTGVNVAQVEAEESTNAWEVSPSAVGLPGSLFTYSSYYGTVAGQSPNAVGDISGHANSVGSIFFGASQGVTPNVSRIDSYECSYFWSLLYYNTATQARVFNQSFIYGTSGADQVYDNYVALNPSKIIVSAVGNGGGISAPASSYNVIAVAAYGGSSSVGPAADGRSKPDITAPGGATSFSTPVVSGVATVLVQAGLRGDGGAGTQTNATDSRTVKALLLNGAVKPADWTHSATQPLDSRYGAGIVNAYNSYKTLSAGQRTFTLRNSSQTPLTSQYGSVMVTEGWDFNTLSSNQVAHYVFDLTSGAPFTLAATLSWLKGNAEADISHLQLFLYDTLTNQLIDSSVSSIDNVQQIYKSELGVGRYDLQVFKSFSNTGPATETYALAFNFAGTLGVSVVPEPPVWASLLVGGVLLVRIRRGRS